VSVAALKNFLLRVNKIKLAAFTLCTENLVPFTVILPNYFSLNMYLIYYAAF